MSTGLSGNALNVLRLTSDPGNGERLFAVTRGGLFSMGNGGAPDTWTPVNGTVDGGTAGIVGAGARAGNLAIDPGNPSHLYFAYFFPNVDNTAMPHTGLLKSTDNGATWVTLPGMNKLVSAVAVIRDGSNLSIYAGLWDEGAAGGVFKSVDGGANWTQIGTGLLSNYVRSFETQGRPAAKLLRVATAAGGIQNFADGSTAALTDINTRLAAFGAVINSKTSTTLLASDLLPFFDANFKHEGWDAGYWSARLVESLNGGSVGAGSVSGIRSLLTDGAGNPVAHTEGSTTITSPQTGGQPMSMTWGDIGSDGPPFAYWRQTGGVWNLYGDQAPGRFEVHARLSNQICNNGVNCNSQVYQNVAFQADTPQGTFTGVSAQGPGLSTATPLNSQGTNGTAPYLSDSWGLWPYPPILASFPPPGTGYIFTAALAGGGTQQIVRQVPRWTNETISMSGPAGHSVANANLGGTLNINWTMPSSFTAAFVNIWLNTASANGVCNFDITPDSLPPSTTSFAVTMPAATCNGAPVADNVSTMMPATLTVNVIGVNGEETEVQWTFGTPIPSGGGDTSPPNQPTISSYSEPVPGSQVTINWTLVTDNPSIGGAGMANYVVRRYPTPGQPTPLATLDAASIMYTDTTVAPGTFYAYSVQACDAAVPSNCSAESTPFGITTGGGGGGSSLSIPSATITLDGQATDWSAINALATDVQGDMVAGYTGSTLSGSDIKALYAAKDSQYLYLRLDLWDTFNTQFGNWPAPNRGSYRFSIVTNSTSVPSLSLGVAYGVSGPEVGQWSLGYNGAGTFPGMTADTGYQYVAVNAGVLELKIPLASMGNPTAFIGIQTAVNDCCTDQGVSTTLDSALAGSVTGAVSWTTKTAMPTARWGAASGVVSGKLYVAGGWNGTSSLATLEVYDPATDTWTTKAPMPTARNGAGAAVINGKLYVVGGDIAQSQKLTTLEVYDPATDAWTTKAAMPTARSGPAVVSINGLLYAAGGCQGWCAPVTNVLEAYDPATDTWSAKAAMPTGRGSASTEVVNNLLYVMGGCCGSSAPESELMGKTIEVYDPATNAWTTRTQHVIGSGNIAGLLSGMIYVAKSTDTEVYNSAADTWSSLSPMSVARSYAAGGVINGTFYVAGGNIATGGTAALEALSVAPDSQAPSVPSAAAATASGSTQINLSWNASTDNVGVTAYKVYRGGTLLATLGNVTSYSDTGVSTSVSYSYTVAACDAAGNCSAPSTASNSVTLQPPATAPGAPTAVSASPGNTQATVSFSAPGSNGGAAITSYTVTPSPGGISASGSASPITVTGLSNGTAYTFTVTATNSVGTGAASAASNSVTPSTNPTFTPALVTGFNLLGNSLNTTLDVMSIFGNQTSPTAVTNDIATVWKWDAANLKWQFHSPLLTTAANADYAASHNYDVLTSIAAGEGYWVNALTAMNLPPQSAAAFNWNSFSFANLPSGFNLIAHAGNVTPSQFNSNISVVPPTAGTIPTDNFATLWAWDAGNVTWFFYSPLLESSGGLAAVKSYADSHFFEHFQDFNKKIDIGVGFWVNKF
ncbi:MAG: hypothetical protein A3H35_13370 [Betaproteobacteria bacterium RIFCSPLOWO2_02_FULL_62_17]|nr:MAG: hypothetical protein A3H35_13370 [Betaproteobacteria bacterium RIFCSPLOWO2_02_FULL_62_17]